MPRLSEVWFGRRRFIATSTSTMKSSRSKWSTCSQTPGSMSAIQPSGKTRGLLWHHDRGAAGFDGETYRQQREGVAQPLSAQGNAHHDRHLRQYGEILSLPLSRVDLQNGRLIILYPVAEEIRQHRT